MTTIHDTIYPRLKTIVSPQDLERVYTPTPDECALAAQVAQDDVAYLGFLIYLKTFQRLGYFVRLPSVPDCIVQHIARSVERTEHSGALAAYDQTGTSRRHQARIRAYRGVKPFREGGHQLIRQALAAAAMQAVHRRNPPRSLVDSGWLVALGHGSAKAQRGTNAHQSAAL